MAVTGGSWTSSRIFARPWRRPVHAVAGACGLVGAIAVVFALGELYLRVAPPGDLARYLPGDDRAGPFRTDPRYGVQYRSLAALAADNPGRFDACRELLRTRNPRPIWAFFGSSFVQAPGMLADTTRAFVAGRHTFNLGKNEPFPVRFAQAEFLLDNGLEPERVFLVVIPLDVYTFAEHGLAQFRATAGGALAYDPRLPAIGAGLVRNSRLALKGWTRTNLHLNRPFFSPTTLHDRVDPAVGADVRTLFENLAAGAARHGVPVTVVLLPDYEQVCRNARLAVQQVLAEDARAVGWDVCDACEPFRAWPNKADLFIPDKHFSATGNRLLLATVLEHLKATDPRAADLPDPASVRP